MLVYVVALYHVSFDNIIKCMDVLDPEVEAKGYSLHIFIT